MDRKREETQGAGLTDVLQVLLDVSPERLLSLTYHLGESPEEDIVQALSLLFLHKEAKGLEILQALKDNSLANHLAEKWHTSGGKLGDFKVKCGHFQNVTVETLAQLARIFKVLSEQKLCDPHLRDLAYWRAISASSKKTTDLKCLESLSVNHLIDEAKLVCGPQFAEMMYSQFYCQPGCERDKENIAMPLTPGSKHCRPSSLRVSSSIASFPTHLEISAPPTEAAIGDINTPVTPEHSQQSTTPVGEDKVEINDSGSCISSKEPYPELKKPSILEAENVSKTKTCVYATAKCHTPQDENGKQTPMPTSTLTSVSSTPQSCTPNMSVPIKTEKEPSTEEEEEEEEDEEETFYSFVILHASEDMELAESMKERLESIGGVGQGATFSEDFALPGRSTLMCIEDAINNSAFTILLLTGNFNTRLVEVETESALINSIKKKHKYNTVIPLLPRENGMDEESMPLVLQTVIPLKENRSFERNVKKVLSPRRIEPHRRAWLKEQQVKKQRRKQERLEQANKHHKQLNEAHSKTGALQKESVRLLMEQTLYIQRTLLDCAGAQGMSSQHPSICIENAQYIMIGNDSQMTVGLGGVLNKDHTVEKEATD